MYGVSVFSDGSIELFDIRDSMVESIIEDASLVDGDSVIKQTQDEIEILNNNKTTSYFFNREDRKEKVLYLL